MGRVYNDLRGGALEEGIEPLMGGHEMPARSIYGPCDYDGSPFWKRLAGLLMLVAFGMLVAIWWPWFGNGRGRYADTWEIIVAVVLIALQLISYIQATIVDPGTVTAEMNSWLNIIIPPDERVICDKSKFVKPDRSHFDNVSERLVLNMDHYCPWVGNTIGFHNRKFFMLLLLYTMLSALFLVCTSISSLSGEGFSSYMLAMWAIAGVMALTTLVFGGMHAKMVLRNETTIEMKYYPEVQLKYSVGAFRNTQQVMGVNTWEWFLPIYGSGPAGDGITWPTSTDDESKYIAPEITAVAGDLFA